MKIKIKWDEPLVLIAFRLQSEFGLFIVWAVCGLIVAVLIAFRLQSEFGPLTARQHNPLASRKS